ncbi:MAG: hypothetical protein KDA83_05960 [Planctomycetales bacterium]|nr:hypothetical protein [Planctomycetales bacterium]
MMRLPRFLLYVESEYESEKNAGCWRFSLEAIDGPEVLEAEDYELAAHPQRLDLIGLVRGLEALDQPSQIQLVTESRYLGRGLRVGLPLWRENDWRWERFGEMTPIKDADLWQRVDHALGFHRIQTRLMRIDSAHTLPMPHMALGGMSETPVAVKHVEPAKPAPRSRRVVLNLRGEESESEPTTPVTRVFRRSGRRNRLGVAAGA